MIIELDFLRKKKLGGTTNENADNITPSIREINNIERAMLFVEQNVNVFNINRSFISEIHKILVDGLLPPPNGEGDLTPGTYRKKNIFISKSTHIPPDWLKISDYMEELFSFVEQKDRPKYNLLKVAIAHHRFVWIHPFSNGNWRSVRLLTYAMLVKMGFNVDVGRILNPTAVFCNNRSDYYKYLSNADKGEPNGLLSWIEYVLKGLKEEIEKIDKLSDYDYLKKEILLPTINYSMERKYITEIESKILKKVVDKQIIQADDIKEFFGKNGKFEVSRQIKKLIEKKMLMQIKPGMRKYNLSFENSFLIRGIIKNLDEKGFLPIKNN